MESKRFWLPAERGYDRAYELAYQLAGEKLVSIVDIEELCRRSGAQYQLIDARQIITLQYLNQSYLITLPDIDVSLADSQEKVPLRDRLLILHYLILAKGTPPANRLITFRELPEGSVYFPTFTDRTTKPLLNYFGQCPERLLDIAGRLGGRKADYGDVAVTIDAFGCVPITIVLWRGDEELSPQGNIVFDATISDYLPTEDITVLCETITWRLIRYLRGD